MSLIADAVFADTEQFAPMSRARPNYCPTVTAKGLTTEMETKISLDDYMLRFQGKQAWNHLAKAVARVAGWNMKESFVLCFNDPALQVSKVLPQSKSLLVTTGVQIGEYYSSERCHSLCRNQIRILRCRRGFNLQVTGNAVFMLRIRG